jgi:lecithin-cholesterol acyltransferase
MAYGFLRSEAVFGGVQHLSLSLSREVGEYLGERDTEERAAQVTTVHPRNGNGAVNLPGLTPISSRVRIAWVMGVARFGFVVAMLAVVLAPVRAGAAVGRTPVVFFPGYGTTILRVTVRDQTAVKGCPRSGSFEDGIPAGVGVTFSQVCRDELLTPRWRRDPRLSFFQRFSLVPGVSVSIPRYGQTASAPVYDGFYRALESAGYTANRNLVVAGCDFRLTPDLGGLLAQTKRLIEQTWRRNGRRPVRLVGHSNGPLYAQ